MNAFRAGPYRATGGSRTKIQEQQGTYDSVSLSGGHTGAWDPGNEFDALFIIIRYI